MPSLLCLFGAGSLLGSVSAEDRRREDRRRRSAPQDYWGPYPDGVPGSGYGCERTCSDHGDVHFEVEARLETYKVPGSAAAGYDSDIGMYTRTFVGTQGPFCSLSDGAPAYDGSGGPLGPCLEMQPGQTVTIKLINNLEHGMSKLQQKADSRRTWWEYAATTDGRTPVFLDAGDTLQWEGSRPEMPEMMYVNSTQNEPGWDVTFDDTNIHIHGMQVVPHLFYPMGTDNPETTWVTLTPRSEDEDQQCFCYVFKVPSDHPMGTYWWHIHRHGSAAMQGWQGMIGLLKVGSPSAMGSPSQELAAQGVHREEAFVIWEWSFDPRRMVGPGIFSEGNYLFMTSGDAEAEPTTMYLVNNEFRPTFSVREHEAMHLRLVCAQTKQGAAIYILDASGNMHDMYAFASDGMSYSKTYKKRMFLMGPGQREGVVVKFSKKGTYRVMQGEINDFQENNGELGIIDEPIAFIHVTDDGDDSNDGDHNHGVDLSSLRFTPGMPVGIDEHAVTHNFDLNFGVNTRLDSLPLPQFVLNNVPFDVSKTMLTVPAESVASWTITSNMNFFHPFHIHVHPFQIKSINASGLPDSLRPYIELAEPVDMWRDTVFIPPYGKVQMLQRYAGKVAAWQGKTVFHCHFLDHEDQGMMAAFLIGPPENKAAPAFQV